MHTPEAPPTPIPAVDPFARILVGIDDTPESLVAAAQAGALRPPGGRVVLVGVAERYLAAHAGLAAVQAEDHISMHASDDLARACELVEADETSLRSGRLVPVLLAECERRDATLIAIGVRPHRLLPAKVLRGHDVDALQETTCSLLVARAGWGPHRPSRVIVGVDGSRESLAAEAVARSLAARLSCELIPVVGLEDLEAGAVLHAGREDAVVVPGTLVQAVGEAAGPSSLVVIGDRRPCGRRGARVVERVVFGVPGSVLVVRSTSGTVEAA